MRIRPVLVAIAFVLIELARADGQTIKWSGFEWTIRSGDGGPGPNTWSSDNVSVDRDGQLHLRIDRSKKHWACAEITSTKRFGYGTYQFSVISRLDQLDKNIVLGLFNYPEADVGSDGTNELDVEFSRWGDDDNPIGNFTAWPRLIGHENVSKTFDFRLLDERTTSRFIWQKNTVQFDSYRGFTTNQRHILCDWKTPAAFRQLVAEKPMPVHLNLWLFEGKPPSDAKPVEVIVKAFDFKSQ